MTQTIQDAHSEAEAITPYSMHVCITNRPSQLLCFTHMLQVSSRYLELTKKKLELTRLPRELELPEPRIWEHGTPKSVLEPLLDFWCVQSCFSIYYVLVEPNVSKEALIQKSISKLHPARTDPAPGSMATTGAPPKHSSTLHFPNSAPPLRFHP
jgi:hypothetical protein